MPVAMSPSKNSARDSLRVALINNMPDSALEDTESQFRNLLHAASDEIPVELEFYSLPGIPRGDRGQRHVNSYPHIQELLNTRLDGVIITGTEPKQPDLRNEPYWQIMVEVLNWAEHNTTSTVLSCLAAHAGVLHSDGIKRYPLSDKQFGVFEFQTNGSHSLTAGISGPVLFPHSRWNELRAGELTACGYQILADSGDAGVDSFVKRKGECLFVHFQGHPEYEARTLLNEYRRDVRRFLKQERPTYPALPRRYFDAETAQVLNKFRQTAEPGPTEELMSSFPEAALVIPGNTWRSSAAKIYRNWLQHLLSGKTRLPVCAGSIQPSHSSR